MAQEDGRMQRGERPKVTMAYKEKIEALQIKAGVAGNIEMVTVCEKALAGNQQAILRCEEVIDEAAARRDEEG